MMIMERVWLVASGPMELRLLVAFEGEYLAYRGAISAAIQELRPHVRVRTSDTDVLRRELARFAPQAVISSGPEAPDLGVRIAWVELPVEPGRTARARLGDRRLELSNPSLHRVLEMVDEAERLLRADFHGARRAGDPAR